jgi:hypothetical protein
MYYLADLRFGISDAYKTEKILLQRLNRAAFRFSEIESNYTSDFASQRGSTFVENNKAPTIKPRRG